MKGLQRMQTGLVTWGPLSLWRAGRGGSSLQKMGECWCYGVRMSELSSCGQFRRAVSAGGDRAALPGSAPH